MCNKQAFKNINVIQLVPMCIDIRLVFIWEYHAILKKSQKAVIFLLLLAFSNHCSCINDQL